MPENNPSFSLGQLAELVGACVQGDADIRISALNGLEFAEAGELT